MKREVFLAVRTCSMALLAVLAVAALTGAEQTCYGPGDISRDGTIDLTDYTLLAQCLGGVNVTTPPSGCSAADFTAADFDGDGDVDMDDFMRFTFLFEKTYFDYGPERTNAEAELLAMEVSGELRAPDEQYDRIGGDLALIRAGYPDLTSVIADPTYVRDELIVSLVDGQPTDGYEALNEFYLVIDEEIHSWGRVLTFCDNLNASVLALEYAALPEVQYGEPNYMIGLDDYVTVTPMGTTYHYSIDDGFLDCFDGCDCHRLWELEVDEFGAVTLISYQEVGMSWCVF